MSIRVEDILDSGDPALFNFRSTADGPAGVLPLTPEMLMRVPSGDTFGWSMNVGMGWAPDALGGKECLILSTHGGIRTADGTPVALGYHTGHWEVGLLVEAAARELKNQGAVPFAGSCTDPCDGRTQGTPGMFDSLAYRNDASAVFRRLIRSLPTRHAVMGVATCDKGLPAMMMALAAQHDLPCILVPGGSMLAGSGEDTASVQSLGARYTHGQVTLEYAARQSCRVCASPGGGCQYLGTASTCQVVAEALGLTLAHAALAPSGEPIWIDMAHRSARALLRLEAEGMTMRKILTQKALHNAMVVHAAAGGSTNLILHLPAVAFHAGLRRPVVQDWQRVNRQVPRLLDALPNGPRSFPTIYAFMAGGVPELMLHLRRASLLELDALTVSGQTLGAVLDWWEQSERRHSIRKTLRQRDGIDPDEVIMSPVCARRRGLTSTVTFPGGNIAPQGSVVKSTAIDPQVVGPDGVYRLTGPARVFTTEAAVIAALKSTGPERVKPGEVVVLKCRGPMGAGMEETYQCTAAMRDLEEGKHIALLTDARFSGVSTGACIGHISPEALAGGPLGKVQEGDMIEIVIDRGRLEGSINLVGAGGRIFGAAEGARVLAARPVPPGLEPDPLLPDDTRLWAAMQNVGGGSWGGSVYDVDLIVAALDAGMKVLRAAGLPALDPAGEPRSAGAARSH